MKHNCDTLWNFVGILLLMTSSFGYAAISESGKSEPDKSESPVSTHDSLRTTNDVITKPTIKAESCGAPIYPEQSRRLGEEGRVVFNVYINAQGDVADITLRQSSGYELLDAAATAFILQCKFEPATQNGKPIATWKAMAHSWKMADDQAQAAARNEEESSRVAAAGGASFLAVNNTEGFAEHLKRFCFNFAKAITNGANDTERSLAALSNAENICSCVESSAKKDSILKLMFDAANAEKHIKKMDEKHFDLYVLGRINSTVMRCAAQSIDAGLKGINPRKKKN